MKYVLIIGAKSELGFELASVYAKNNYNLYLAGRSIQELEDKSEALEDKYNIKSVLCELDVTDYNSHQKFYESLKIKPIGVIYLAGYYSKISSSSQNWSESLKTVEINYLGCLSILNIVADEFKGDRRGFIIAVSSVSGLRGRSKNYIYGSSKAAMIAYLSGLRNRLSNYNINVLTVIPGFLSTKKDQKKGYPRIMVSTSKQLANRIFDAQQNNRNVIYSSIIWYFIMFIIKLIPESLFKKLNI